MEFRMAVFVGCWVVSLLGCSDGDEGSGSPGGGGQTGGGSPTGGADGSGGSDASSGGGAGDGSGGTNGSPDVGTISAAKRRIAAGRRHACAVTEDRRVECWGFGQSDVPDDDGYESVAARGDYSCALKTDGASFCWRNGGVPTEQPLIDIAPATSTTGCGLSAEDGRILCWPDATTVPPGALESGVGHTRVIRRGTSYLCTLATGGTVSCWRDPDPFYDNIETGVPSGSFVDLWNSVGRDICAITSRGEAFCWGSNQNLYDAANGDIFRQIVPGGESGPALICGILPDRTAECFGSGIVVTNPPPVGVEFAEIAVGEDIACGIALDGAVHCWGDEGIERPPAGLTALVD